MPKPKRRHGRSRPTSGNPTVERHRRCRDGWGQVSPSATAGALGPRMGVVHSPSYKRFLFREGSISVIGTVESVDNRAIGPVGRGTRVCMTGGLSLSRIPRVCGENLLFARRPPTVHKSAPVIPSRCTAFGRRNLSFVMACRVREDTETTTRESRPGEQSWGSERPGVTSIRSRRQIPRGQSSACADRRHAPPGPEGTRGAWKAEKRRSPLSPPHAA